MLQAPVNYGQTPVQQPSYNAVKIDIHNPKGTDNCPMVYPQGYYPQPAYSQQYPSAYSMPQVPYYSYPQAQSMPYYPVINNSAVNQNGQQPTCTCACHNTQPAQQAVQQQTVQPEVKQETQKNTVQPQVVQQQPQVVKPEVKTAQAVQPQVMPVPVVPAPAPQPQPQIQQVINNGVPTQQTIQQTPVTPTEQTSVASQPAVQPVPQPEVKTAQTVEPNKTMPQADISPVLRGLQSNNLAEQSDALSKIGEVAENPQEVKKYLETSVLDALLGILNSDTSNLPGPTPAQIEARTKWMNEKPLSDAEKQSAMTLAPQEVADRNKQHALYSISILQKALANEVEAKTGEKLSLEKLPAIDQVVNVVKSNPNPLLRASAIVALAHLNKDEYKPVLSEIFTLAQNDQDPNVKQVATEALAKLNGAQKA